MSTRELRPSIGAGPDADLDAAPDAAPADGDAASFEALYARLEQVAERLGAGGLSLEESVDLYEEGMRLAARCERLLDAVEQRVETLRHALADGEPLLADPRDADPRDDDPGGQG